MKIEHFRIFFTMVYACKSLAYNAIDSNVKRMEQQHERIYQAFDKENKYRDQEDEEVISQLRGNSRRSFKNKKAPLIRRKQWSLHDHYKRPNNFKCWSNSQCRSSRCVWHKKKCEPKVKNGGSCWSRSDCESDYCRHNKCAAFLKLGEVCTSSYRCEPGTYCGCASNVKYRKNDDWERCSSQIKCLAHLDVGQSCFYGRQCKWDSCPGAGRFAIGKCGEKGTGCGKYSNNWC